jgi:penicillin-binding protein 1A
VQEPKPPEGVLQSGGEWFYEEFYRGAGVSAVGLEDKLPDAAATGAPGEANPQKPPGATQQPSNAGTSAEEKKKILDLFRN